ncbi:MAG: ABC transporter permease [Terracidiphilus sp.]|jgi:predicted permease
MDFIRIVFSRCKALFRGSTLDADLDEELRAHIELAVEEKVKCGMSAEAARRAAMKEFGGVTQTKESYRLQRGLPLLETLARDLRFGFRQLRKSPGFAITAILTLALGAGSVTAVFSVVNGVLLRPYAFLDSGKVVVWRESIREMEHVAPLLPDNYRHYLNLKTHANTIQDAAILQTAGFSVSGDGGPGDGVSGDIDHPQMTEGLAISPNFFSVLGVTPVLGRAFAPHEAETGRDQEIILTWGAWQRLFHGSESALGAKLRVDGTAKTVVGILPRSFRFPVMSIMPGQASHGSTERYEIFKPLVPMPSELVEEDGDFNFLVVARLKPGVSVRQAQSELDGIEKASAAANHVAIHLSVIVEPFAEEITGDVRKPLWLLLAAVMGVLLMACVNLANLQIARGMAREHEIALRSALGAGSARLLQGVLIENLLLGVIGGLGGAVFAIVAEKLLALTAASLPRMNEIHMSGPMLGFALGLSVLTSMGFGIFPALRSLRVQPQSALQSGSTRVSGNKQAVRSRRVLVAVEVACSVTLLVVTALITRSFAHVLTQDRQFDARRVSMAKADLSAPRYSSGAAMPDNPGADEGSLTRDAMIDRTLDRLRTLPGVQSAAMTSVMPLTGDMSVDGLHRPDHPVPDGQAPLANRRFISPGYFEAMEIPLLEGRDFDLRDRKNPRVVILSGKAARAAFPGEEALGHTIHHWNRDYTVVGIAADARINDLKRNVAIYYLPHWDFPPASPVFLVRSSQGIQTLGPEMRKAIWAIDPDISIPTVVSLDAQVGESVAMERFQAIILSSFGGAALFLAVLGIYGVLAYSVSLRKQEFGIRIALGSNRSQLARLVLMDAFYPMFGGIALGLLGAAAAARWISSLLFETSAADPWAIGLSLAVLLLAALLASLLPVRSATSADPMRALRTE